jgi:hypothetical protein
LLSGIFIFSSGSSYGNDEVTELKRKMEIQQVQMEAMQKNMAEMQKNMDAMRERMKTLEAEKTKAMPLPAEKKCEPLTIGERAEAGAHPWTDMVKVKGAMNFYFIGQDHSYFVKERNDRFIEVVGRLGADVKLTDKLSADIQLYGETIQGDFDEYTAPTDDDWSFEFEFLNFTYKDILDKPLSIKIGRQNIEYGDGFIVYDFGAESRAVLTGALRSLYAAKITYEPKPFTIDAFAGMIDRDLRSYEAYYRDFTAYTGRRNVFGGNIHFEDAAAGILDLLLFYKQDWSGLESNTLALSFRASVDAVKDPVTLNFTGEIVPEFGNTKVFENGLGDIRRERLGLGGHADIKLTFNNIPFTPYIKERFAYFSADDPDTRRNEGFDPLFYGFYDWGSWYLGNINAYNLFNTNDNVLMTEIGLKPTDKTSLRFFYYDFWLNRPIVAGAGKDFSREFDVVFDWYPNCWLFLGAEFGYAHPLKAARAYAGDDQDTYEMWLWAGLHF